MANINDRKGNILSAVVFIALVAAAATLGGMAQPGEWYARLQKPAWNPPDWVFGPVWTVLYLCIAAAGWYVWRATKYITVPLVIWGLQLLLNAAWSWLFFGMHRPDLALVDIVLLLATILAFIASSRRYSRRASGLFVPYALWVGFATALNAAIWQLNRG